MNDKAWFDRVERQKAEKRKLADSFINNSFEGESVILDEEDEGLVSPLPLISTKAVAKAETVRSIISAYNEIFSGKKGYKEPVVNPDGSISLSFSNSVEVGNFFMDQAQKGHAFLILDPKTRTVVGYSDGKDFYHHNGEPFHKGQMLADSSETHPEGFEMPHPISSVYR